jgi:hypothetical protein
MLERFQAVQNQQRLMMGDKFRQTFTLLPCSSHPWIWISKPSESSVDKFI